MDGFQNEKMKKNVLQQCINVMRADWLKMSIFAPKKLCSGRTVNRSEIRTTLILERCHTLEKNENTNNCNCLLDFDYEL